MNSCLRAFLALSLVPAFAAPAGTWEFDFSAGGNAAGNPTYSADRGFGFEPGAPTKFSVRLPEGNYRITARFQRRRERATIDLLSEQRRLMIEKLPLGNRKGVERTFIVNVRTPDLGPLPANAAGGTRVALKPRDTGGANWDDKLTLEFLAEANGLASLSIVAADVPTLYLAGDSTVTDQAVAPNASWGQMLPRFFGPDIAVANHAESGESLKSFLTELRFDKLLSRLRAGDWVMIQFAHNDQKTQWPQTYAEAATTYRAYLRAYVAEVRRRGATPILVTSPDRRNFDAQGKITSTLGEYPDAMRAVAREESVALIDLNVMSRAFYEALGPEMSARAFADDGRDRTHFNAYGGYALARCIVAGLRAADARLTAGLATHLAADAGRFDPAHPDPPPTREHL